MGLWAMWLDMIRDLINLLSSGIGLGFAIVIATLLLRAALLPLSWSAAYRGCIRQKKMAQLQPKLQDIKDRFGGDPNQYLQHVQALYARHGLSFIDGKGLLASLIQMPILFGMFQVLRGMGKGVRFLWVPELIKPDLVFALIAGITTALMTMANPDLPENMRTVMLVVFSIGAFIVTLKFCSALALYWSTSNCFTAVQTMAVHFVVKRRIRSGAVKI